MIVAAWPSFDKKFWFTAVCVRSAGFARQSPKVDRYVVM